MTPFMRWLERGCSSTTTTSRARGQLAALLHRERLGQARAARSGRRVRREALPYGYEDLDLAKRMHDEHGFRLLFNREAVGEHLHEMTLDGWRANVSRERADRARLRRKHPEFPPYFHDLFAAAAARPPARGRGRHLIGLLPAPAARSPLSGASGRAPTSGTASSSRRTSSRRGRRPANRPRRPVGRAMSAAAVLVAVVSYNTRGLLDGCLSSLRADAERGLAEVAVVDNASTDGSAELVRERHPWVTLHTSAENLGFGPAVNLAASAAGEREWIAPGERRHAVEPGALEALVGAGATTPRRGIVAPRLILPDGSTQHSVYAFPTLRFTVGLPRPPRRPAAAVGRGELPAGPLEPERPRRVPWAVGAFLLVRGDRVGGGRAGSTTPVDVRRGPRPRVAALRAPAGRPATSPARGSPQRVGCRGRGVGTTSVPTAGTARPTSGCCAGGGGCARALSPRRTSPAMGRGCSGAAGERRLRGRGRASPGLDAPPRARPAAAPPAGTRGGWATGFASGYLARSRSCVAALGSWSPAPSRSGRSRRRGAEPAPPPPDRPPAEQLRGFSLSRVVRRRRRDHPRAARRVARDAGARRDPGAAWRGRSTNPTPARSTRSRIDRFEWLVDAAAERGIE